MTIVEYINEENNTMRMQFIPDGKVEVMQSHGISIAYLLNYKRIKEQYAHIDTADLDRRVKLYLNLYVKR